MSAPREQKAVRSAGLADAWIIFHVFAGKSYALLTDGTWADLAGKWPESRPKVRQFTKAEATEYISTHTSGK